MDNLRREMLEYRSQAFAVNTKKTYACHLRTYYTFCDKMGIPPVPIDDKTVTLYATYLARTHKPASVRQYLCVIGLLHKEMGLSNPSKDSWLLTSTLRGIDRIKGCEVKRKKPITADVLLNIRSKLNLDQPVDAIFWGACLTLFYGLLRKSNLFPDRAIDFDAAKQLTREAFAISGNALSIAIKWSKTIQLKEKTIVINLPCIYPHPLCPVTAILKAFKLNAGAPSAQAFPLSGPEFNRRVKVLAGPEFSSHSFRRGGATHALSCGIPAAVIKCFGDWKSDVFYNYLDQIPMSTLEHYRFIFAKGLPSSN